MRSLITILLSSILFSAYAQRQNVYYIKGISQKVSTRDSADFIRIVREPDSGSVLYKLTEYYGNGTQKLLGLSSTIDPIKFEGISTTFDKNGKRRTVLNFKAGRLLGDQYYYYPNGKLREARTYLAPGKDFKEIYLINTYNDSTGKALVTAGNGHYQNQDYQNKTFSEGELKDGLKQGEWKTSVKNDSIIVNEIYNSGTFVKGTAKFANGEVVTYDKPETLPQFPGGVDGFGRFLGRTLRYPADAQRNGIQGRVMLSFVVEKDGSLTNIHPVGASPSPLLTEEATRVLNESPKWQPGMQYGRAVRVQYTVPIIFNLGR
ncbi:TonB family protein [Mucilaginibacter sp. CSA2-8R]|uniref:TonB family protein n=1 Tax=Mucilaginibacter sp. CSA2-8R TaxID=3141542 RepID=UPI00315DA0C9